MQRARYNAKARSAHKKKAKHRTDKQETVQDRPDPNATIVVPKTEEEKEQERKLNMREEVREISLTSLISSSD